MSKDVKKNQSKKVSKFQVPFLFIFVRLPALTYGVFYFILVLATYNILF